MSNSSGAYARASQIASLLAGIAGLGEYQRLADRTARVVWDPAAARDGGSSQSVALVLGGNPEKPSVVLSDLAGWYPLQQAIQALTAFPEQARTPDVIAALLDPAIDRIAIQADQVFQARVETGTATLEGVAASASPGADPDSATLPAATIWTPRFVAYMVGLAVLTLVAVKLGGALGVLAAWAVSEGIRRLVAGRGVALPASMVAGGALYWLVLGFVLLVDGVERPQPTVASAPTGGRTPYYGPVVPPGSTPAPAPAAQAPLPNPEQQAWDALMLRWEADNATFLQDPARARAMQAALDAHDSRTGGALSHEELLQFAEADAFRATRWDPRTQTVRKQAPDTKAVEAYLRSVPELQRD